MGSLRDTEGLTRDTDSASQLLLNQKQEETPFSLNATRKNVTTVTGEREKKKTVLMGGSRLT